MALLAHSALLLIGQRLHGGNAMHRGAMTGDAIHMLRLRSGCAVGAEGKLSRHVNMTGTADGTARSAGDADGMGIIAMTGKTIQADLFCHHRRVCAFHQPCRLFCMTLLAGGNGLFRTAMHGFDGMRVIASVAGEAIRAAFVSRMHTRGQCGGFLRMAALTECCALHSIDGSDLVGVYTMADGAGGFGADFEIAQLAMDTGGDADLLAGMASFAIRFEGRIFRVGKAIDPFMAILAIHFSMYRGGKMSLVDLLTMAA